MNITMETWNITSDRMDSLDYESHHDSLKEATTFLSNYYMWIVFAFGFPGNLISFLIIVLMSRKNMKTSFFYVALLAVVDNIAIILKVVQSQIKLRKLAMNELGCQSLNFFGLIFTSYSNWILIVISIERLIVVFFPMKVAVICTLRRAVIGMIGVFVLLCLIHLHLFFTTTEVDNECTEKQEYHYFMYHLWPYISTSIYAFIPAVCITFCSVVVIVKLLKSSSERRTLTRNVPEQEANRQEHQLTLMLVTVAIVFIILTVPRSIFLIYNFTNHQWGKHKLFVDDLTNFMADSNNAVNFYLYFIAGPRFREYLLGLFSCDVRKHTSFCRQNTNQTGTTDIN